MKNIVLLIMVLTHTFTGFAQTDNKYLEGAVPVVDGKVVFSKNFSLQGKNKTEVYNTALQWAKDKFNTDEDRVIFTNPEDGTIVCSAKDYLVFTNKALSLDRSLINYRVTLYCYDNNCNTEISNINYAYNVSYQKEPEKYKAEEWIDDENALSKGKLNRGSGKFRKHTIDLVDNLFAEISTGLNAATTLASTNPQSNNAIESKPAVKISPATTTTTTTTAVPFTANNGLEEFNQIDVEKIPGNIIKMLGKDWMLITAGNGNNFNMMTASWGGLGMMFGKPTAFSFVFPARNTYSLLRNSDTYTLSFYPEAYRDVLKMCGSKSGKDTDKVKESGLTPITTPSGSKAFNEAWLIIECRKTLTQPLFKDGLNNESLKNEYSSKDLPTLFGGEIINAWIKY